ncbi:MAG: TorF family putative porin [Rhodovarius sp.]|nr:TorF family putative porin [Rhodovarius sp.]
MRLPRLLLVMVLALPVYLAAPASAQIALGHSGFTVSGSVAYQSDYLFRGISQTASRMAGQGSIELSHESGFYIGAFISNVYFPPAGAFPQRAEIDGLIGFRFTALDINFDIGGVWYTYHGQQTGFPRLNYAEAVVKAAREFGPVTATLTLAFSPNFFGSSGFGFYSELAAEWATGLLDLNLGGRVGYQHIARTAVFGAPSYSNWAITISRSFEISGYGTLVASVGYYDTSIGRASCFGGMNVCAARALGSLTFKF